MKKAEIMYQVIRKIKGFYYVAKLQENDLIDFENIKECKLKGTLKKNNSKYNCVVGDYVEISENNVIEKIFDRKNILERPLISNIDYVFITFSVEDPTFDFTNFQKLLLYINKNNIKYSLILTKCDLISEKELKDLKDNIYELFNDIDIIEKYKDEIPQKIYDIIALNKVNLFLGPSGVGKSTLLKTILNLDDILTQEISKKLKRGKNTTVESRFYNYNNSVIIDTPGFSNIFYPGVENIFEVYSYFPDILKYINCKFNDCKHINEIECGVKKALEKGELSTRRYSFYKTFIEENLK